MKFVNQSGINPRVALTKLIDRSGRGDDMRILGVKPAAMIAIGHRCAGSPDRRFGAGGPISQPVRRAPDG
jgi:hypothetical protein